MADNTKTRDLTKGKREIPYSLVIVFLALSFSIVFAGYIYYSSYKKTLTNDVKEELISICDLKVNQLVLWRKERLGDAKSILNNLLIADEITDFLKDPVHQAGKEKILSWLMQARDSYDYKEVAVFDLDGKVIFSTEKYIHHDEFHIRLAKNSLDKKEVAAGDLHKNQATGEIDIGLFIPVFISEGKGKHAIGGIMLLIDPNRFLYPLIQEWPVPSETAETLLVRQDGNDVLYLNELRHKKNTALSFRIPITNESLPAAMAVRGREGVVEGRDYRDIPVMAAIRKVPDTGWYFIAKMDLKEAYLPADRIVPVIAAFVIAGILAAVLGIGLYRRNKITAYYRGLYKAEGALRESEERFSRLFNSMMDAYVTVDMSGKITGSNNVYREMLGYSDDEMPKLSYSEITPDKWHAFEARIVEEQVLKKDFSDVYEKEYRRKDGTVFPVELRTYLMRDKDGNHSGMWAVVRDITERKKAEEALKRYSAELEKSNKELQEALSNIRTLRGMLPICASCKKIRDDKGYWKQVESYVSEHTEAVFSHGICPECANKAYTELEKLKKKDSEFRIQNKNSPEL